MLYTKRFLSFGIKFTTLLVFAGQVHAEVTLDGSMGTSGSVTATNGNYSIGADLGQQSGANLFHSFSDFNIESGRSATFTGPSSVSNIVARVTGDSASSINGQLASTIAGANLWLINPKGVLFGAGASLDIQGSFHASTANYVQLRDGTHYSANLSDLTLVTSSAPQAFGFISDEIADNGLLKVDSVRLSVPEGEYISLVGSNIQLSAAVLSAQGGQVSVVSINEAGEVYYSDQGFEAYNLPNGNEQPQQIDFTGSLTISSTDFKVNGAEKGNLQIEGGDIEINTHNTDFVSTVSNLKASFFDDVDLLDEPCELAEFYGKGSLSFTVNEEDEETRFGVEVKKARGGALGLIKQPECL